MSPEEFDNRLKSSFQDEFLPPKEQLWQNINQRLDQSAAQPFWYWLVPVIVVFAAGIAWLGIDVLSGSEGNANNIAGVSAVDTFVSTSTPSSGNPSSLSAETSGQATQEPASGNSANTSKSGTVIDGPEQQNITDGHPSSKSPRLASSTDASSPYRQAATVPSGKKAPKSVTPEKYTDNPSKTFDTDKQTASTGSENTDKNARQVKSPSTLADAISQAQDNYRLSTIDLSHFPMHYQLDNNSLANIEKPGLSGKRTKQAPPVFNGSRSNYRSNFNNEDLESKWWFQIGVGPQLGFNSLKMNSDSQEFIHKDLWNYRKKVTHDGVGFQSHATFLYKFGKNNRFGLEFGLNYSRRTEKIELNEYSYDIAHRDTTGRVDHYIRFNIYYTVGTDTDSFAATQVFTSIEKNRYNIFTIPLRFQSEHKLTENTFLSLALGGGLSMITTGKSTHYNLVSETNVKTENDFQFSPSLNASFNLFTNFNDYGQVGIYSGFQMYTSPWKVHGNQYAIKMSDLQFGVMFRKPLNWGK